MANGETDYKLCPKCHESLVPAKMKLDSSVRHILKCSNPECSHREFIDGTKLPEVTREVNIENIAHNPDLKHVNWLEIANQRLNGNFDLSNEEVICFLNRTKHEMLADLEKRSNEEITIISEYGRLMYEASTKLMVDRNIKTTIERSKWDSERKTREKVQKEEKKQDREVDLVKRRKVTDEERAIQQLMKYGMSMEQAKAQHEQIMNVAKAKAAKS